MAPSPGTSSAQSPHEAGTSGLLWEMLFLLGDRGQPLFNLPLPLGFLVPSLHGQHGPKGSDGSFALFWGRLETGQAF